MKNNVYDIQKKYTQVALDWIEEYQGDFSEKNKKELLQLLQQTEQEFIQKIQGLPKEKIQDEGNRKLLSMTELKHKLIQDIAIQVIGGTEKIASLYSMKQLVTYIAGGESEYIVEELVESLSEESKDIPIPDIQGTIEQIGEVILPPDVLERFENSYTRGQQQVKKRPAGFDKIGLVEQFLSDYLGRARATFQWKTGVLRSNQMRKVSYYHLYLPEINKTLLLNNQYGEGCFLVDGNFNIRKAKKLDIKGTEGVVAVSFDHADLMNFLGKLRFFLDHTKKVHTEDSENNSVKEEKGTEKNRDTMTEEKMREAIQKDKIQWMNLKPTTRPKYSIELGGEKYSYTFICRIFGFEEEPNDLFKDKIFNQLTEKICTISWIDYLKTEFREKITADKITWMNLNTATRRKYNIELGGEKYSYILICRIFGFEEELDDLFKDEIFNQLTEKICTISWIDYLKTEFREKITADKITWMNLNTATRRKYNIELGGEKYSYILICRIFGFEEEQKDLFKDEIFNQLTEKIFGKDKK